MNSLEPIGAPRWSLPLVISTPVSETNINCSFVVVVVRFLSVQGEGGEGISLSLSLSHFSNPYFRPVLFS